MLNNKPSCYQVKGVCAGQTIEIYKYENMQMNRSNVRTEKNVDKEKQETSDKKKIDRTQEYINKSKRDLRRIINANLHKGKNYDKFVTLTFAKNVTDKEFCLQKYRSFIKSLQRSYGKVKYITVLEKQKRGAYHFHMILFDFPYIDLDALNNKWKHGYTDIQAIKDYQYKKNGKTYDFAMYLVKYLGKDFGGSKEKKERRYYKSNNLYTPVLLYDKTLFDLLGDIKYHQEFSFQFESKYVGKVDYTKLIAHQNLEI